MSQERLYLTLHRRWWVAPYMALLEAFVWLIVWTMEPDDEQLERFAKVQGGFIAKRGFVIRSTPDDPGELS